MNITIRKETPNDYREAEEVTRKAFWNRYMPGCEEHYLVHKLREADEYLPELSYVAIADGKIVGAIYYATSYILDSNNNKTAVLTFGPVSVLPEYQRKNVGKTLVTETMKLALELHYKAIVICGVPAYYPKFGFLSCQTFGITMPNGATFPAFMAIEFEKGYLQAGKFFEPAIYHTLPRPEVEEYDRIFPEMEKLVLPGQWKK